MPWQHRGVRSRENFLEEVASKMRPEGKQRLTRQREQPQVPHAESSGLGVKVRSGKRQGWEVGRADGGRVCCLRKFGLWREIGSYRGF